MWSVDARYFEKLEEACGSKFIALQYIMNLSRKYSQLVSRTGGEVLDSKLLSWAITGKIPEIQHRKVISHEDETLALVLSYITDDSIIESVTKSYKLSVRSHHLVYVYEDSLDEKDKARVRILVRMAWL